MSWGCGTLATEIYEIDKPIGHSFGDVGYYTGLLAGAGGPVLDPVLHEADMTAFVRPGAGPGNTGPGRWVS